MTKLPVFQKVSEVKILPPRFLLITLGFLLVFAGYGCRPEKENITEYDMKRVMERFASARIQTGVIADVNKPTPSDQTLFEEACDVYRLPVEKAKLSLKEKNSQLYESIYGK